jgi:hypothetical protein
MTGCRADRHERGRRAFAQDRPAGVDVNIRCPGSCAAREPAGSPGKGWYAPPLPALILSYAMDMESLKPASSPTRTGDPRLRRPVRESPDSTTCNDLRAERRMDDLGLLPRTRQPAASHPSRKKETGAVSRTRRPVFSPAQKCTSKLPEMASPVEKVA